jgi:hypothetical protein
LVIWQNQSIQLPHCLCQLNILDSRTKPMPRILIHKLTFLPGHHGADQFPTYLSRASPRASYLPTSSQHIAVANLAPTIPHGVIVYFIHTHGSPEQQYRFMRPVVPTLYVQKLHTRWAVLNGTSEVGVAKKLYCPT